MPAKIAPPPNPMENYRAAVAANPQSAEAHSNLGWGLYGQKQFTEAIQEFKEAIQRDPNLFEANYGMALAYKCAGSKAEAIAAFKKTLALAEQMDDSVRGKMLVHFLHAHINRLNRGDWGLDKELRHHE